MMLTLEVLNEDGRLELPPRISSALIHYGC
jgi:hypothetical protein